MSAEKQWERRQDSLLELEIARLGDHLKVMSSRNDGRVTAFRHFIDGSTHLQADSRKGSGWI